MATLLLRLQGAMQSWGTRSKFDDRDTEQEPSKSGVLGMACAALGIDRTDWEGLEPLTKLRMGVRVNSAGVLRTDFQTAQLKPWSEKTDTAITRKHYLADADFIVGLEGDKALLESLHKALKDPVYPLCLGRRAYPPGKPVWIPEGLREDTLEAALEWDSQNAEWPEPTESEKESGTQKLRLILESPNFGEGSLRRDVPSAAFSERKFGPRYVDPTKTIERKLSCTSTSSA